MCYFHYRNEPWFQIAFQYENKKITAFFKDQTTGDYKQCFELEIDLDFDEGGYFLISASSGFVNEDIHKVNSFAAVNPLKVTSELIREDVNEILQERF